MHLQILDQHNDYGIDFDGTLVEHPRSKILQQYIVDHPEKRFYLISFRTHQMVPAIERHLRDSTDDTGVRLTLEHFQGVHCVPREYYEQQNISFDHYHRYWGWKAKKCQELGCTIMVDDMHETISPYFNDIGIVCLNPDIYEGYMEKEVGGFSASVESVMEFLRTDRGQVGECKGDALNELHRRGRIVWYREQAGGDAYISWPVPNDFCWVELTSEKFHDVRIKAIEVLGDQKEADKWLETPAIALNQQRPIDLMMDSLEGCIQVEELLGRIEAGVYT